MSNIPALDDLIADPQRASSLSVEALQALAARCALVHRVIVNAQTEHLLNGVSCRGMRAAGALPDGDRLLDIDEAAHKSGLSKDQLYRRNLPFKIRTGARQVRFSEQGIESWIKGKIRSHAIL